MKISTKLINQNNYNLVEEAARVLKDVVMLATNDVRATFSFVQVPKDYGHDGGWNGGDSSGAYYAYTYDCLENETKTYYIYMDKKDENVAVSLLFS